MQRLIFICLLFFTVSCNSKNEEKQPTPQAERWVVFEKKRYEHKLNALGRVDTTFVYTYSYKDGNLVDSAISFSVYKYKGSFQSAEHTFTVDKDKQITQGPIRQSELGTNGKPLNASILNDGKLMKLEKYGYNDSNLLTRYTIISTVNEPQNNQSGTEAVKAPSLSNSIYDTVIGNYVYDNSKKVTGVNYINSRGNLVRKDVNIYSAEDPLLTFSTNSKGDTLQKITYKKDGRIFQTIIENDSFVLVQNLMNGIQVAQMTIYKTKKEKWRSAFTYDSKGRKIEDILYKAM